MYIYVYMRSGRRGGGGKEKNIDKKQAREKDKKKN